VRKLLEWFQNIPHPVVRFRDEMGRPSFIIGIKWRF